MALSVDQLTAVSKTHFDPRIKQQVYEESFFFAWLKKKGKFKEKTGKNIQVPIRYKKLGQAEAANPRSQFVYESKETRTALELEWTYYRARTLIHWDEINQNAGAGEIVDLLGDKGDELLEDMQELLYSDLFATTQGTRAYVPLASIIDSATTYGGIAVADAPAWASVEDAATTKLLAYGSGSISAQINASTFGKNKPTCHITTRDLQSAFESIIAPMTRYEQKEAADLGFNNVSFHGQPVVGDTFCPAGYWYGVDDKQFEVWVHPNDNMDLGDWFDLKQAGFPKAKARYGTWVGNIVCRMRRTSFKMTALDYTL